MTNQVTAETLSPIAYNQCPVITTELLAHLYGTEPVRIRQNHHENKTRFEEGKHFFKLEGDALRELKHRVVLNDSVKIARNARSLILWTERGAARHAKMLETDQAWEVFEKLEDCYFNSPAKEQPQQPSLPLGNYHFPAETADPHNRRFQNAWMTPKVILDDRNRAPELELLEVLQQDGYDVTGVKIRIQAMYSIVREHLDMQSELEIAVNRIASVSDIIKNLTAERGTNVVFGGLNGGACRAPSQRGLTKMR